jgi:hypothetical protein
MYTNNNKNVEYKKLRVMYVKMPFLSYFYLVIIKRLGGIKVALTRLGIYLLVSKARGVGCPEFLFILCDVTTV